jgi:hypothetical protein
MPTDNKKEAAKLLVANFKKNVDEIEFAVNNKDFKKQFKKQVG